MFFCTFFRGGPKKFSCLSFSAVTFALKIKVWS
ncbi:unnamed protein product, partial [marine sediment metagenome]